MQITVQNEGDIVILTLEGRMDLEQIGDLDQVFQQQLKLDKRKFLLNMIDVTDISSSGIGKILTMFKKLETLNGHMALAELSAVSEYVLELARLSDIFPIFKTNEAALKSFQ